LAVSGVSLLSPGAFLTGANSSSLLTSIKPNYSLEQRGKQSKKKSSNFKAFIISGLITFL